MAAPRRLDLDRTAEAIGQCFQKSTFRAVAWLLSEVLLPLTTAMSGAGLALLIFLPRSYLGAQADLRSYLGAVSA